MSKVRRARKAEVQSHSKAVPQALSNVRFKYVFEDNYNPVYANGAYGGPTSQGEVAINFYVERQPVPIEESWTVSPDGTLGKQVSREPQDQEATTIIRFVTGGVIMNRDVAKRIYDFIGRALAQVDDAITARTGRLEVRRKVDLDEPKAKK